MTEREFTAELDECVVLKLTLSDYPDKERPLGPGLVRAGVEAKQRLLQHYFDGWEKPFNGKVRGWRKDSPFICEIRAEIRARVAWNGSRAVAIGKAP